MVRCVEGVEGDEVCEVCGEGVEGGEVCEVCGGGKGW